MHAHPFYGVHAFYTDSSKGMKNQALLTFQRQEYFSTFLFRQIKN
jgi:hypothetical protein